MARESLSLGNGGPTLGSRPTTAISISLPESLGDFSSGFSWNIPHLNDLDLRKSTLSEQAGSGVRSSAAATAAPAQTTPAVPEQKGEAPEAAAPPPLPPKPMRKEDEPLSNAINIILARSRAYEPLRKKNEQPWWTTRSEESAAKAEKARANMQDKLPPEGTELYFVYPRDCCKSHETRSIDQHLEDSVEAYAMHRSQHFEGVLFWRAFLTKFQVDTLNDMLEVEKVEHQPRPDPTAKRMSDVAPFFTPSRENKKLDDNTPWPPGKSLYVIWARHSEDEKEVRSIDGQLEEIAGPENVYVEVYPTQVYFWRAFLTKSQSEIVEKFPEVGSIGTRLHPRAADTYDPTDC